MSRICAVGAITPMGNSEAEIWDNLDLKKGGTLNVRKDYNSRLGGRVRRRNSRFSDLAATAAMNCYDNFRMSNPDVKNEDIGCILSTDYGPLETNMEFAKQIVDGDPDACSPIVFSNTVHNACLGTIAIELNITGPNTMLMGSDAVDYSEMILEEKKAKTMICGGVEEYNAELKKSIDVFSDTQYNYGDVSVVFAIDNEIEKDGVNIIGSSSIGGVSAIFEQEGMDKELCEEFVEDMLNEYTPDVVICSDTNSRLKELEKNIINNKFKNIYTIDNFNEYFGMCLGAELPAKMLVAKMILEHKEIPEGLKNMDYNVEDIKRVAVLSTDITGNYYCKVMRL